MTTPNGVATITDFLLARVAEAEQRAKGAQDEQAPATGEHWRWVYTGGLYADQSVDVGAATEFLGDHDEEHGIRVSLRSVEEYPTQSVGPLPNFVINYAEEQPVGSARHIAYWEPSRVLAWCESMRKLIELHYLMWRNVGWFEDDEGEKAEAGAELQVCGLCVPGHSYFESRQDVPEGPCDTMKLLALTFSDHPEYQESWRP